MVGRSVSQCWACIWSRTRRLPAGHHEFYTRTLSVKEPKNACHSQACYRHMHMHANIKVGSSTESHASHKVRNEFLELYRSVQNPSHKNDNSLTSTPFYSISCSLSLSLSLSMPRTP